MGLYLNKRDVSKLKEYKYSSTDLSLISKYILRPYWNQFVKLFPIWIAPNLVTLIGLCFVVINFFTVIYYNPTLDQDMPSWVYYSAAAGLFMYQTFDACDGLQARRSGSSSPLGELFDHGVDAINTTLEVVIFSAILKFGFGWKLIISQVATLMNFYLSTWEEYYTGTLFLSYFSGPVEGILLVVGIYIYTGIQGASIWSTTVLELVDYLDFLTISDQIKDIIKDTTMTDVYMYFAGVGLLFNIVASLRNVAAANRKNSSSSLSSAFGLGPMVILVTSYVAWLAYSPELLSGHAVEFLVYQGIIFAFVVGRVILAHLTKQSFPYFSSLLLLNVIGIISKFIGLNQVVTLHVLLAFTFGIYISFIGDVLNDITDYLGIKTLKIKPKINEKVKTQ